ncbi:hypothetical protein [Marinospirillum sp.]|uniref:hypothetical protein n=1 Tax=Marinospirillum sp. TaxID=2183934 RepID=UPI00384B54AE
MHTPTLARLALTSLLAGFTAPLLADAGQITGTWQCQQQLSPDPQVEVEVRYEQQFTPNRNFNIDGNLSADFADNTLAYTFRGNGTWSVTERFLDIETADSEFLPDNPTALQMHEAGILTADQFNNVQSSDRFEIIKLDRQQMHLKHSKEDFVTQCTRR